MAKRWYIEGNDDEADDRVWNIHQADGDRVRCVATVYDEKLAETIVSALKWVDAMGGVHMSLAMDGIVINANTGEVWQAPKKRTGPALKITKATTKKPR